MFDKFVLKCIVSLYFLIAGEERYAFNFKPQIDKLPLCDLIDGFSYKLFSWLLFVYHFIALLSL